MSAQPPTNEMTFVNNESVFTGGEWYVDPIDDWGQLTTNFSFGTFSSISIKAKIYCSYDYWQNSEFLLFKDSANNNVAYIFAGCSQGWGLSGIFAASTSGADVTQTISGNFGYYYLEMVATSTSITFKVYNSSNSLIYTLAGGYKTGKSFSDIAKAEASIYSSSAGSARIDDLVITIESGSSSDFLQLF